MTLRFGSVCSGIEAASVAWEPLDWHPQFYSEIEPFPCAVLHHHWSSGRPRFMPDPDEPGLSDKDQKARRAAIKAVSRLPEQANGVPNFGDMTQFEEWPDADIDVLVGGTPCQSYSVAGLRKGLDDPRGDLMLTYVAIARRYRPRWVVWENVFGVLSINGGRDFASLLGLLSGRRVEVPAGGWRTSGIVEGYSGAYGLSWRVLDTQFVRVDGAPRALPQRRRRVFVVGHIGADWRRAAAVLLERHGLSGNPAPRREPGKGVAPTIASRPTGGGGLGADFDLDGGLAVDDVARCVTAGYAQRIDWETENFVAHVAPTMRAGGNQTGGDRPYGTDVDTCDSLVPIAYSIMPQNSGKDYKARQVEVAQPVMAGGPVGGNQGGDYILAPIAFNSREDPEVTFDRAGPLGSSSPQAQAIAFAQNQRDELREMEVAGALAAEPGMKQQTYLATQWAVRRLTPTECARLQGFDDNHCRIPWRGKPAEQCPDGPQYKAYGNSMSTNVMRWIGERIQFVDQIERKDAV